MDGTIWAKRLILPDGEIENGAVRLSGDRIAAVGRRDEICGTQLFGFPDGILSPGLFDMHIHGCAGKLCDESPQAVKELSAYLATTGVSSFLATAMTLKGCKNVKEALRTGYKGARIAGIYMEGPFLAARGLESADKGLLPASLETLFEILEAGGDDIKIMGLAIEEDGAVDVIKELKRRGIVVSAAHTKATYEGFMAAKTAGVTHATHLYNVMTALHHRRPGVVGAVLSDDDVTTELICDGVHLHPAAIDVALRCKGASRTAMITDMTLGGIPDGEYSNGTVTIVVKDNVARFKGIDPDADHAIAGSTRPMSAGLKTVTQLGYPLCDAIKMASLTPARIVGLDGETGSLEVGKKADIAVFDESLNPLMTVSSGEVIYKA